MMKRHEALAPLSRDHHGSLILARLLKKGAPEYKGLPADRAGKMNYALQQYGQHIKKHFEQEELILQTVKQCHPDIERMTGEISREHQEITGLFLSLNTADDPEDTMNRLGIALETHIRKEERVLFPLLQQHCPENILQQIHALLH